MLPLECHYVAEIRYQEHVAAAQPTDQDGARWTVRWPRMRLGQPSRTLLRDWLKLAGSGRSVRLSAR
jgi:hypothetical protein